MSCGDLGERDIPSGRLAALLIAFTATMIGVPIAGAALQADFLVTQTVLSVLIGLFSVLPWLLSHPEVRSDRGPV